MSELREGLALALVNNDRANRGWPAARWSDFDEPTQRDYLSNADAALAYLRAHDGHAEFVRKVMEIAERAISRHEVGLGEGLGPITTIAALCNNELAKEQSK